MEPPFHPRNPDISRLECDGLVERTTDENDKRACVIRLKKAGQMPDSLIEAISSEMNGIFYRNFSDREIVQFEDYLQRILDNCKAME